MTSKQGCGEMDRARGIGAIQKDSRQGEDPLFLSSTSASSTSKLSLQEENYEQDDDDEQDDDQPLLAPTTSTSLRRNMGVSTALTADGPIVGDQRFFSKANIRPIMYCAVGVLGAVLYGYDGTYFAGILAMKTFLRDYGEPNTSTDPVELAKNPYVLSSGYTSLLASIVQAGEVVGSLCAGPIGDYGGRKGGLLGACVFVTIGVILQLILVGSIPLIALGRGVLGMGVGVVSNATPMYLSEIAPTAIRGIVVSSWQLFLALGQVLGAVVDQGTKSINNTGSYRIPIALNLVLVLLIVIGLFFIPESPRWLLGKDRDEAALAALARINHYQPDPTAVIEVEYNSFSKARAEDRAAQGASSWASVFTNPVERRKFLCVVGILVSQQIGGVQFIFSYTTTFMRDVGLNNEFLITIIVDVVEVFGVLVSFLLVGRFGRRALLLTTSVPMFMSLYICAGLGTVASDQRTATQNQTIAAMIMIYVFVFNLAWGPLAWVIASELCVGVNRSKILSVATASFWIVAWAVTFTLPYLFTNAGLGPQIGWIYGTGTLIAMGFVYFYIPETRGKSLEEISECFEARLPALKWKTYETESGRAARQNVEVIAKERRERGEGNVGATSSKGDDEESAGSKSPTLSRTAAAAADGDFKKGSETAVRTAVADSEEA